MDYVAKHAKALAKLQEDGVPVVFVDEVIDASHYNPLTDGQTDPTVESVPGNAVEIPGNPEEYEKLELIVYQTITLLFVPTVMGQTPKIGNRVVWAGELRTVKYHFPIRPAGVLIADRVLIG
jgi:hypothetical protein